MNAMVRRSIHSNALRGGSTEQNNDLVADAIALNWYKDDLDQHPFNRRYFWFAGWSIAVKVGNIHELPQEHYEVLRLYLSASCLISIRVIPSSSRN
jgi:hypothetical protein